MEDFVALFVFGEFVLLRGEAGEGGDEAEAYEGSGEWLSYAHVGIVIFVICTR